MTGKRILSLEDLQAAMLFRKSVIVPKSNAWKRPKPAAVVINQQGWLLLRLFRDGMFIYEKPKKERQENHDTDNRHSETDRDRTSRDDQEMGQH